MCQLAHLVHTERVGARTMRDAYGVKVLDPRETAMVLAITVAIDSLAHDLG